MYQFVAPDYTICSIVLDTNVACFSLRLPQGNDEMKALGSISSLFTRLGEIGIDTEMVMLLAREDEPFQELNFTIAKLFREKVLSIIESHKPALGEAIVFVDNSL